MRREENGALMLYIVIAVVVFSLLAGIMARNYSASTRATARPDCQKAARLMAESGVRYAMSQLRTAPDEATFNSRFTALNGQTFTLSNGSSFTLTLTGISGGTNYTVSATGNAPCLEGDPASAGLSRTFNVLDSGSDIAFDNGDLSGFDVVAGDGGTNAITVHNDTANPGNSYVELGGNLNANYGAIWYTGSKGDCVDGNCPLGNGVRAYFEFQFNSGSNGDGFVFALISAVTNTKSTGGDTSMGELLGYGGAGTNNIGLLPPKIGLEFDIYHNDCNDNLCSPGSRCDGYDTSDSYQNSYDHLAFVQWGEESGSTVNGSCSSGKRRNRYDDNRHNAGTTASTTEPRNPAFGEPGYYVQSGTNWLQNGGLFRLRYELTRSTTASSNGYYCYELRAWLQSASETMTTGMDDLTKDFAPPPTVQEVFYLSSTLNTQFNNFYFGWTEGTGAATQLATLKKFALAFKDALPAQTIPQSSNLRARWTMRSVSGSSVPDVVGTNTGTANGSYDWVPGVGCPDCPALRLYGSNSDYASVPDRNALDLTTAGSIAAWVYIPDASSLNSRAGLVHKGSTTWFNTTDAAYTLQFWPTRLLSLTVTNSGGTSYQVTSANAIAAQGWHHVAGTWGSSGMSVYIDGTEAGHSSSSPTARTNSSSLYLGRASIPNGWDSTFYPFNGILDEVYLYSVQLTGDEIQQLYKNSSWGQ